MYSKLNLIIVLALVGSAVTSAALGGLEDEKPADEYVRKIVEKVQKNLKTEYPKDYSKMVPISYRTQLVNGINYFIKVAVTESDGTQKFAHLRVHESFKGVAKLAKVKPDVGEFEQLQYFQ